MITLPGRLNDGRYNILQTLGSGSYATDWLARDHEDNRLVSIKCIAADSSSPGASLLEVESQRYLSRQLEL